MACLLLTDVTVRADSVKQELERGVLGLPWGATPADIQKRYSAAYQQGPFIAIKQPEGILGVPADRSTCMFAPQCEPS